MRVLFTSRPGDGHFYPMHPLLAALVAAGDDVAVATAQPLLDAIEAEGVHVFPAGLDDSDPIITHHRRIGSTLPVSEIRRVAFTDLFVGAEVPARLEALEQIIASFRPDLVVHEIAEFAGPIAAAANGIPYVTHSYGPLLQPDVAELAGEAAAPLWRSRGLEPPRFGGLYEHLYLDICPPSMQVDAIDQITTQQPIGRRAEVSSSEDAEWIEELSDQPIVYVTLGTVFNRLRSPLFATLVDGLRDQDLNVVVTVGRDQDPSILGSQPSNVVVRRFVPQVMLLPHCAAVVTHGGAGSVLGALSFGLPLLVVPQAADQFYNAERVVAAGAGRSLIGDQVTSAGVRSAVRQLLDDPTYRAAARRIKAEFDDMPDPAAIRSHLLNLI